MVGNAFLRDLYLREGKWDIMILDEMTISLQNYSLASFSPFRDTLLVDIHPLVHEWIHSNVPEQAHIRCQSAAVLLLAMGVESTDTPWSQYLAAHIIHLRPIWNQLPVNDAAALGAILYKSGFPRDAVQLQERLVTFLSQQFETIHPNVTKAKAVLALAYHDLGRFDDAKTLQEQVLQLRKDILGEQHQNTIAAAINLALTYSSLGHLKDCMLLQEEVLRMKKELLGEDSLSTVDASHNLRLPIKTLEGSPRQRLSSRQFYNGKQSPLGHSTHRLLKLLAI